MTAGGGPLDSARMKAGLQKDQDVIRNLELKKKTIGVWSIYNVVLISSV